MSSLLKAKSILEVIQFSKKGKIGSLILKASEDLVCNNLWCEKVGEPCICRFEVALQSIDSNYLTNLDVSNNNLLALPPSLNNMIELKELNLSNNLFTSIPINAILSMPKLEQLIISNNPINNLEKELEILLSKNINLNIIN